MSRWKPEKARKKTSSTASTGRLISCLTLLVGGLLLLFFLIRGMLMK